MNMGQASHIESEKNLEVSKMRADGHRIDKLLKKLALHNITPGKGLTRPSYSSEYMGVCRELIEMMKELGMKVCMDEIGNIVGRKEGKRPELPAVCIGSHMDSVRNGGIYDGPGGVVAGLEAVRLIMENNIEHDHSLHVMSFVEEEGTGLQSGLLGSRWFNGEACWEDIEKLKYENSENAVDAVRRFRNEFPDIPFFDEVSFDPENIRAFMEVHIEQGPVLENNEIRLGVVSAIAGTSTIEVSVSGRPDHAGSTPMDMRSDAFEVAAHTAVEMYRYARSFPHAVATVGRLEVPGGSSNRVPDRTWFTIDLRSADPEVMDSLIPHAKETLEQLSSRSGTSVSVSTSHFVPPIELDKELRHILLKHARKLTDAMEINSGAAHDSLVMAKHYPVAMLFVPCTGGRSHCPEESADPGDFALSVDVMVQTFLEIDR